MQGPRAWIVALAVVAAGQASAQEVVWESLASFYGDNTEFFTPYRVGETILGGQFWTRARIRPSERTALLVGVFGDVRWGSDDVLDTVKPILGFRYQHGSSLAAIGTLETERRHGFLDALAASTLELTRPIEYGLQWIERRRSWDFDAFINWQRINTPAQREAFDYGWVVRVRPLSGVALEHQLHGLHRGGQLFSAGAPVTNNAAWALGVTVGDRLGPLGFGSAGVYLLRSSGNIEPNAPEDRPSKGRGTLVRLALEPVRGLELFGLWWRGRDYLAQEGDNNYNSVGHDPAFYREQRKYLEIGAAHRGTIDGVIQLDAELRFHRIDDEPSEALLSSSWEYSYRLITRVPLRWRLSR